MKSLLIILISILIFSCNQNKKAKQSEEEIKAFKDSLQLTADTAGFYEFQRQKADRAELIEEKQAYQRQSERQYVPHSHRASGTKTVYRDRTVYKEAPVAERRGISKTAKGAIIGGTGGAVVGAVVNKKDRVAGAVIGGVIGAGAGAVIGRQADKRDGRN